MLIAILSKILGCASGAFIWRFNAHDAWTVGFGMITRGEVELIAASIGLQTHLLTPTLFSITVLIIFVTTMITPLLLKMLYSFQPVSPTHAEPKSGSLDDKVEQILLPADAILIEE